jgi:lysozyme
MIISQKGIDLIKSFEKFEPRAYICPTGHLTIGYGTVIDTKEEEYLKTAVLTEQQASKIMAEQIQKEYGPQLDRLLGNTPVNQNQYDALLSFIYNEGAGNLKKSNLLKTIKQDPNSASIESEFRKWVYGEVHHDNGTTTMDVLPGLQKRRASEAILYNTGILKLF